MGRQQTGTSVALIQGATEESVHYKILCHKADQLVGTDFVPPSFNNAQKILACIMKGDELGIKPLAALSSISVIQGRPTCSAELMRGLILRDHGDDAFTFTQTDEHACTVRYKRRNEKEYHEYTFTWEMATKRGLNKVETDKHGNPTNWYKFTDEMLRARATSAVARMHFPDSIGGMYIPEELEDQQTQTPANGQVLTTAQVIADNHEPPDTHEDGVLAGIDEEIADAEFTEEGPEVEITAQNAPFELPAEDTKPTSIAPITRAQVGQLAALYGQLGKEADRTMPSWTAEAAEHAITDLQRQVRDRNAGPAEKAPGANRRERLVNLVTQFKGIAVREGQPESAWKDVFERYCSTLGIAGKDSTGMLNDQEIDALYAAASTQDAPAEPAGVASL